MKTGFWLAAFVPALALCLPCGADIHYVSPTGSASPPYTNWTDAATAIQAAVNAAAAGDTVLVTNGTYHLTAEIVVTNAITIGSVHGPDVTTVDGQGTTRCFSLGSSACLLSGFTITDGRADLASPGERGAGVYCLNGTPAVSNCTFAGNHANGFGGGMFQGTAYQCTFTNNTSGLHGGGKYWGGAHRCRFIANSASGSGGGAAEITAYNCLFTGNHAGARGGGTFGRRSVNCTVTGNAAGSAGGGIYGGSYGGTVLNCIVFGNTAAISNDLFDIATTFSCSPDLADGVDDNTMSDPQFRHAAGDDYRLSASSPCIDAGTNQAWMAGESDLSGNPRIHGLSVDMGAYEFYHTPLVDITSLSTTVSSEVTTYTIDGTNNEWTVGHLAWSNAANGVQGSVPVSGLTFQVQSIPLEWGDNIISVTGANAIGDVTSDVVTITRNTAHGGDSPLHYVSINGLAVWPYTNWTEAATSIQDAVDAAWAGDTVHVASGVYTLTTQISITNGATVQGQGGAGATILDGQRLDRGFYITAGATIVGLTIRNAYPGAGENGGGVYCDGGGLIQDCVLEVSRARFGAGVFLDHGGMATGCVFRGNFAEDGSGAYCNRGGVVMNSVLTNNYAMLAGGGIYLSKGGTVQDSLVTRNQTGGVSGTDGGGGGIYVVSGGPDEGGLLQRCTISRNVAYEYGSGGVHFISASPATRVEDCIIYYNHSTGGGLGDYNAADALHNCCSPGLDPARHISAIPEFVDEYEDFRLSVTSPCIDVGLPHPGTQHDVVGTPRPIDGDFDGTATSDIGAYEYDPAVIDTDGDGRMDEDEHAMGFNMLYDESYAVDYGEANVTGDPGAYGLYTSNSITDLDLGTLMLACSNGVMLLDLQLQQSTNLDEDVWSDLGDPVEWEAPAEDGKAFYRVWGAAEK